MSLIFRDMLNEDLDQIIKIELDLFDKTAWSKDLFLDELARMPDTRWYQVMLDQDQVIGYIGLAVNAEVADIQTIAVIEAAQQKGLGSRLLELAIKEAKNRGAQEMFLEVATQNEAAINLYRKFGFTQVSIRPNYYGTGKNAFTMKLDLVSR
ncbi:MAG: ribosomal-protein-alanine N-acetyltransferase [Actinobacteria bacterium]|nr:ribosomal-protein-alanine N-acetyltransferase [Actinomycetota bacterium]